MARFELWQDGMCVAAVDGADRSACLSDIAHYGLMYGQDGPVETFEVKGRKRIKLAELSTATQQETTNG